VHRFRATPSYCGVGHLEEEAELGPGEQPLEERGVRTRTEAAHLEQERLGLGRGGGGRGSRHPWRARSLWLRFFFYTLCGWDFFKQYFSSRVMRNRSLLGLIVMSH
jgi:hypothetical protein